MAWCSQRGVAHIKITEALLAQPGTTLMRPACNARIPARTTGAGCIIDSFKPGTCVSASEPRTDSLHLHNDLPLGSASFEMRKRLLRLIERKYLVEHRPDVPRLEKLTDLGELTTVWMREQE